MFQDAAQLTVHPIQLPLQVTFRLREEDVIFV